MRKYGKGEIIGDAEGEAIEAEAIEAEASTNWSEEDEEALDQEMDDNDD